MTLFANIIPPKPDTHTLPRLGELPNISKRIPGLGYILFPNTGAHDSNYGVPSTACPDIIPASTEAGIPSEADQSSEFQSTVEDFLSDHAQRRRELEAEEARKGEEDWVRSGGVLRDAEGRRDWVRTQAVREELKLRELEAQILDRWDRYEKRWAVLLSRVKLGANGSDPATFLRFDDIPWPVETVESRALDLEDLTVQHVERFLLEGLTIRSANFTKKDRVRSSLLRWHPDKLGNLLQKVNSEDTEIVMKGLGIVMECLQRLNTHMS